MILTNGKIYGKAGAADFYELSGDGLVGAQVVKGLIPTKELRYISGVCDNESIIRVDIYLVKGFYVGMDALEKGSVTEFKFENGAVTFEGEAEVASKKIVKHEGKEVVCISLTPAEAIKLA